MGTSSFGSRWHPYKFKAKIGWGSPSVVGSRGVGKRGVVANFIVFFGATIAIVLILVVYMIGGGIIKKLNKSAADIAIYDESDIEIDNIFDYSDRYVLLSEAKFLVAGGKGLDDSLLEVGYG
ncbi:hypothetical protein KAT36_00945 [Candidatus Pacearchaeota archaeon]|nr:hypothetical protein [Candidatus Pacearchaeota archaeon]